MQAAFFRAEKLKMLITNAFDQKLKKKQPTENYYHSSSLIKKEKTLLISTIHPSNARAAHGQGGHPRMFDPGCLIAAMTRMFDPGCLSEKGGVPFLGINRSK